MTRSDEPDAHAARLDDAIRNARTYLRVLAAGIASPEDSVDILQDLVNAIDAITRPTERLYVPSDEEADFLKAAGIDLALFDESTRRQLDAWHAWSVTRNNGTRPV